MTKTLPLLRPVLAVTMALAWTVASFGVLTSPAQAKSANHYTAELQQPVAKGTHKSAISGTYWQCNETNCSGVKSGSSAMRVCASLAKRHGKVETFSAKGKAFDEAKLAKCNK